MSSSSDSIFGITTTVLTLPAGVSSAQLFSPGPYCQSVLVKYFSGGSLNVWGAQAGVTAAAGGSIVAGFSLSYMLGSAEVLSFAGPARFYVGAVGATAQLMVMMGLSVNHTPFVP